MSPERRESEREAGFVKQVVVDGSTVNKPTYARGLTNSEFAEYLVNVAGFCKHDDLGIWQGGAVRDKNKSLLEQLAKDRNFLGYLESVVRSGEDHYWDYIVSILADELIQRNQAIEIILPERRQKLLKSSDHRLDEKASMITSLVKRSRKSDGALPRLGTFLREGTVIFRGNVDEVSALRGGMLYIDGDVNRLTQCPFGIVYVNGDVYHLGESEKVVLVVTGKIHEYVMSKYSTGGLEQEVTPSPFIFPSEEVWGQRIGERVQWGPRDFISNTAKPFKASYVVERERLLNWSPQETPKKALALCHDRIDSDLDKMREIAKEVTIAKDMAEFYKKYILGYITGKVEGYYRGARDFLPPDD
jgi:hypothetical protein